MRPNPRLPGVTLACALALAVPSGASAEQLVVTAPGSFSNAVSSNGATPTYCGGTSQQPCSSAPAAQVRWGAGSAQQSGLGWAGASGQTVATGSGFAIGELTHFNYPVYGSIDSTRLNLTVSVRRPDTSLLFGGALGTVVFDIDETPNDVSFGPCAYESTTPCADRVSFNDLVGQAFVERVGTVDEYDEYTLTVLGFRDTASEDAPVETSFISQEGQSNSAFLVGRLDVEHVVVRAAQTIDFPALADRTYGDGPVSLDATASSGLPVSYAAAGDCVLDGGSVRITGAGTCDVTASQSGDSGNLPAEDVAHRFSIAKAGVTISFTPLSFVYDGTGRVIAGEVASAVDGSLGAALVSYTPAGGSPQSDPVKNAGTHTVTGTFAGDANHHAATQSKPFVIARATPTITLTDRSATYDAAAQTVAATVTGATGSALAPVKVTYDGSLDAPRDVGSYAVVAAFTGDANHEPVQDTATLRIEPRALTAAAADATRPFGTTNPALTGTLTGVQGADAITATYTTTATTASAPGTYPIVPSLQDPGGRLGNYAVTLTNGTLRVTYRFGGFDSPVDAATENRVNAGRAIPVRFSLGGDFGLGVFADGYPRSVRVACGNELDPDEIEETVNPGSAAMTYNASTGRYQYVWKTSTAWAGQCRVLELKFDDGVTQTAFFRFR